MEANPEGAEAEELLWSLGVGEALPEWLKELRTKERSMGLNQKPRASSNIVSRPGIGPQRAWSGADGVDIETAKRASNVMPAAPSPAPMSQLGQKPTPSSASASSAPVVRSPPPAAAARPVSAAAADAARTFPPASAHQPQERRTDPDDGKAYSMDELMRKYEGMFGATDIEAYFKNDCTPAVEAPRAPTATVLRTEEPRPAPAPAPARETPKKFDMSIKDWLSSLDDSGFLIQYHDGIAGKLDSLEQLVDIYVKEGGEVDPKLFVEVGIKKLGHKRLFEKWFRENCGPGRAPRA
mmetsp:Transcript_69547/g.123952  ORF Transcript_69547/g.123952 Transcript_69547/m.123952 type:complete len:295 (-) Transcript_69547:65-949(-)